MTIRASTVSPSSAVHMSMIIPSATISLSLAREMAMTFMFLSSLMIEYLIISAVESRAVITEKMIASDTSE